MFTNMFLSIRRPDLGVVASGSSFPILFRNAMDYRKANGIPVGLHFEEELERIVCEASPGDCFDVEAEELARTRRLNYHDVVVGTEVMASIMLSQAMSSITGGPGPTVSQDEAERRAAICSNQCKGKFNVTAPTRCGGLCGSILTIVQKIVGNKTTKSDDYLGACYICGCFLKASVWVRADLQIAPLSDSQKAEFAKVPYCWKGQAIRDAT